MRKIINSTYITLDGVIAHPENWPATGSSGEAGTTIQTELLRACDAVLLGRETYDSFAGVWEGQSGDPYSEQMNSMEKYVFSTTLRHPTWQHTTVLNGDVAKEVSRIKAEPGKNIVQYGFGPIAHALLEHNLLDEVRLWVHPFFLRTGGTEGLLFQPGSVATLELIDTTPLDSGIVVLSYATA